jgi:hypothetical protein
MSVNDGTPTELDLDGSTFSDPVPALLQVQLHAGANTISIGNPTGYAPDLDCIVIAPSIPNGGSAFRNAVPGK